MNLVEEKYCTTKTGLLSRRPTVMWELLVHPPARQLEIAFRLVENRPDVIDAYSRCAKFLENRVRAFGDETRQCRFATAEAGCSQPCPLHWHGVQTKRTYPGGPHRM